MTVMTNHRLSKLGGVISRKDRIAEDFRKNKFLYFLIIPVIVYYLVFMYWPMYGVQIAFKDFSPGLGIFHSPWAGFKHFYAFFTGRYFVRVFSNTLLISSYGLLFGFTSQIVFALLLNEIYNQKFRRSIQTISYLPHFISLVVICGIIKDFVATDGIINDIMAFLGGGRVSFLQEPEYFRAIYIISGIWQEMGWNSIIYIAALSMISPQLYEASVIDGAGRWKQLWNITLPGILPTITILLILNIGRLLNVGFEKIILLYNPATYDTADVISSFVYRKGLQEMNFSYSTAVGLFNSVINFVLLITANFISRKVSENSLW